MITVWLALLVLLSMGCVTPYVMERSCPGRPFNDEEYVPPALLVEWSHRD